MPFAQAQGLYPFEKQFNIMALVGNGFDIQVMQAYDASITTQYPNFYHFMKMNNAAPENLILREMERAMSEHKPNWSDVEECVTSLADGHFPITQIRSSLDDVRKLFSEFLNTVVSPSLLSRLSDDSQKHAWAKESLSRFLADIDDADELRKIPFGMRQANYDLYNFFFVNFNYTALLDNYIFLDSEQFDPLPHSTVDTNFVFNTDPKRLSGNGSWNFESSGYVETQVVHPHGYQDIPRSLLFGTNGDGLPRSPSAKLAKTYWARVEQRYGHLFDDTHLFIVFGCSLGSTDSWWWKKIAAALEQAQVGKCALLLYWWNPSYATKLTVDEVRERFFECADVEVDKHVVLTERICVVSYADGEDRVWLNSTGA